MANAGDGEQTSRLAACVARELERRAGDALPAGLYLVATPIGNLGDITIRALAVLANVDVIYCEDTRHSSRLLQHYAITTPTRPFHEHNETIVAERILSELAAGKSLAIISDAGTPLISDPGFKLVRAASQAGHMVSPLPGPTAAIAALAASGLATDAFFFAGFLPPKSSARRARLADLKAIPSTLIFYEAPQRLADMLADAADILTDRPAAVARELTKLHERLYRAPLRELQAQFAGMEVKGEIVIVVAPPEIGTVADEEISARLSEALKTVRLKDAAQAVADALGVPKSRVYNLALKIKDGAG